VGYHWQGVVVVPDLIRISCQDAGTRDLDPMEDGAYLAQRILERGDLQAIDAWLAWAGRGAVVMGILAAWPNCSMMARCLAVWRLDISATRLPTMDDCRAAFADPFAYPAGMPTPEMDAAAAEAAYRAACSPVPGGQVI
jgi:hypothetical protein